MTKSKLSRGAEMRLHSELIALFGTEPRADLKRAIAAHLNREDGRSPIAYDEYGYANAFALIDDLDWVVKSGKRKQAGKKRTLWRVEEREFLDSDEVSRVHSYLFEVFGSQPFGRSALIALRDFDSDGPVGGICRDELSIRLLIEFLQSKGVLHGTVRPAEPSGEKTFQVAASDLIESFMPDSVPPEAGVADMRAYFENPTVRAAIRAGSKKAWLSSLEVARHLFEAVVGEDSNELMVREFERLIASGVVIDSQTIKDAGCPAELSEAAAKLGWKGRPGSKRPLEFATLSLRCGAGGAVSAVVFCLMGQSAHIDEMECFARALRVVADAYGIERASELIRGERALLESVKSHSKKSPVENVLLEALGLYGVQAASQMLNSLPPAWIEEGRLEDLSKLIAQVSSGKGDEDWKEFSKAARTFAVPAVETLFEDSQKDRSIPIFAAVQHDETARRMFLGAVAKTIEEGRLVALRDYYDGLHSSDSENHAALAAGALMSICLGDSSEHQDEVAHSLSAGSLSSNQDAVVLADWLAVAHREPLSDDALVSYACMHIDKGTPMFACRQIRREGLARDAAIEGRLARQCIDVLSCVANLDTRNPKDLETLVHSTLAIDSNALTSSVMAVIETRFSGAVIGAPNGAEKDVSGDASSGFGALLDALFDLSEKLHGDELVLAGSVLCECALRCSAWESRGMLLAELLTLLPKTSLSNRVWDSLSRPRGGPCCLADYFVGALLECGSRAEFMRFLMFTRSMLDGRELKLAAFGKRYEGQDGEVNRAVLDVVALDPNATDAQVYKAYEALATYSYKHINLRRYTALCLAAQFIWTSKLQLRNLANRLGGATAGGKVSKANVYHICHLGADFVDNGFFAALYEAEDDMEHVAQNFFGTVESAVRRLDRGGMFSAEEKRQGEAVKELLGSLARLKPSIEMLDAESGSYAGVLDAIRGLEAFLIKLSLRWPSTFFDEIIEHAEADGDAKIIAQLFVSIYEDSQPDDKSVDNLHEIVRVARSCGQVELADWCEEILSGSGGGEYVEHSLQMMRFGSGLDSVGKLENPARVVERMIREADMSSGEEGTLKAARFALNMTKSYYRTFGETEYGECAKATRRAVVELPGWLNSDDYEMISQVSDDGVGLARSLSGAAAAARRAKIARLFANPPGEDVFEENKLAKAVEDLRGVLSEECDLALEDQVALGLLYGEWGWLINATDEEGGVIPPWLRSEFLEVYKAAPQDLNRVLFRREMQRAGESKPTAADSLLEVLDEACPMSLKEAIWSIRKNRELHAEIRTRTTLQDDVELRRYRNSTAKRVKAVQERAFRLANDNEEIDGASLWGAACSAIRMGVDPLILVEDYQDLVFRNDTTWVGAHIDDGFLEPPTRAYLELLVAMFNPETPSSRLSGLANDVERSLADLPDALVHYAQQLVSAARNGLPIEPRWTMRGSFAGFAGIENGDGVSSIRDLVRALMAAWGCGEGNAADGAEEERADIFARVFEEGTFGKLDVARALAFAESPAAAGDLNAALLLVVSLVAMRSRPMDQRVNEAAIRSLEALPTLVGDVARIQGQFSRDARESLRELLKSVAVRAFGNCVDALDPRDGDKSASVDLLRFKFETTKCGVLAAAAYALGFQDLHESLAAMRDFDARGYASSVREVETGDLASGWTQLEKHLERLSHAADLLGLNTSDNAGVEHDAKRRADVDDIRGFFEESVRNLAMIAVRIEDDIPFDGFIHVIVENRGSEGGDLELAGAFLNGIPTATDESAIFGCGLKGIRPSERRAMIIDCSKELASASPSPVEVKIVVRQNDGSKWRKWSTKANVPFHQDIKREIGKPYVTESHIGKCGERYLPRGELSDLPSRRLHTCLKSDDQRISPVIISGARGVGKTVLARTVEQIAETEGGLRCIPVWYKFGRSFHGEEGQRGFVGKLCESALRHAGLDSSSLGVDDHAMQQLAETANALRERSRSAERFEDLRGCLQRLCSQLVEMRLCVNAVIDEAHEMLADERNRWLLQFFEFVDSCEPGLFCWVFVGSGALVHPMTRIPGVKLADWAESFLTREMTRVEIASLDGPGKLDFVRSLISSQDAPSVSSRPLGNMAFSESALSFVAEYTGGHARSVLKIANGLQEWAELGYGSFKSPYKRTISVSDVYCWIKHADGRFSNGEMIVESDMSSLKSIPGISKVLENLADAWKRDREGMELKPTDASSLLQSYGVIRKCEGPSGKYRYQFASELYANWAIGWLQMMKDAGKAEDA